MEGRSHSEVKKVVNSLWQTDLRITKKNELHEILLFNKDKKLCCLKLKVPQTGPRSDELSEWREKAVIYW